MREARDHVAHPGVRELRRREAAARIDEEPALFPKEAGSTTRVRNFNDLWIVEIGPTGAGTLLKHVVFDIVLERQRRE